MSLFSFLTDLFTRKKSKQIKKNIEDSSTILRLNRSEYRKLPYEDLWRSAIRCKLVLMHHSIIHAIWRSVNMSDNTLDAIINVNIDEEYIRELRNVSEPFHFNTKSNTYQNRYNTSFYFWHTDDTIYITFHVDRHVEEEFLKKQSVFTTISDNICVNEFFYTEACSILKPIISRIEALKNRTPRHPLRIVIAGYSLAGIIVQIMSAIIGQYFGSNNAIIFCHTFGSPKAGNRKFVNWFNTYVNENYRIINGNDPMVLFPVDSNWCHVSKTTLQFDTDLHMNISDKEEHIPWYKRLWMRHVIYHRIIWKYRRDHIFDIYINRIWKYSRITNFIETSYSNIT